MTQDFAENWNRYALIIELAKRYAGHRPLGKKALQKLVYLLQELKAVPVGYRFRFFTYGPYSDDLAYTLDVAESLGAVNVNYDQSKNAYEIAHGDNAKSIATRGKDFLKQNQKSIDSLISQFGERTAKDLELTATIVYLLKNEGNKNEEKLADGVLALKPKYDREKVLAAIRELKKLGYYPSN